MKDLKTTKIWQIIIQCMRYIKVHKTGIGRGLSVAFLTMIIQIVMTDMFITMVPLSVRHNGWLFLPSILIASFGGWYIASYTQDMVKLLNFPD